MMIINIACNLDLFILFRHYINITINANKCYYNNNNNNNKSKYNYLFKKKKFINIKII